MTLPELSIKRHVLAWMLSAVLVLFGLISYERIGMDRYPSMIDDEVRVEISVEAIREQGR